MTPHCADATVQVYAGDCLDVLATLPDNSVDAVVTDPPYEIGFMGKGWDATGIAYNVDLWRHAHRILKPGGHLLAFGGTRTWHRLACAVEDAGFEVRDSLAWMSGSGFPKSLNVSKALTEKDARCRCSMGESDGEDGMEQGPSTCVPGVLGDVLQVSQQAPGRSSAGLLAAVSGEARRGPYARDRGEHEGPEGDLALRASQPLVEGRRDVQAVEGQLHRPEVREVPAGTAGDGAGGRLHHGAPPSNGAVGGTPTDALGVREPHQPRPAGQPSGEPGALPDERRPQAWGGWPVCERCSQPVVPDGLGTALKPAFEPVVVARKPLTGTVAANVLAHGTGALNIDGCRNALREDESAEGLSARSGGVRGFADEYVGGKAKGAPPTDMSKGRWPANVILDEDQADALDQQSGTLTSGKMMPTHTTAGVDGRASAYGKDREGGFTTMETYGDAGGASRFFYTAKASSSERVTIDGIAHPTVKPLDLMRWLVRLVTPPGGTVLEPFAGSGTTVEACILEGFKCIAIERETDYLPLITQRIHRRRDPVEAVRGSGEDGGLFDLLDEEIA